MVQCRGGGVFGEEAWSGVVEVESLVRRPRNKLL